MKSFVLAAVVMRVASGFSRTVFAQQPDLDPRIPKLVAAVAEGRLTAILSGHHDTIAIQGGQSFANAGTAGRDAITVTQPADPNAPNELGFAAVGFRESRENFARQHDPRDTFEGLSPAYLARNARVNAAAAAALALAPPAPGVNGANGQPTISRGPAGYDANLK